MRKEKRGCRERSSNLSLRSTKIEWSSSDGSRFKVGVLGECYAWIPKTPSFAKVCTEDSGSRKLRVQEVFVELPRVVAHPSRGRDSSYFGCFYYRAIWLSFNALRGCLDVFFP